jgi:hypothetical protein
LGKKASTEADALFIVPFLEGRRPPPFSLRSFLVGPETSLDFLLIEDSFAGVEILSQETPQRRHWANGQTGFHFNCFAPPLHIMRRFTLYVISIRFAQVWQLSIPKVARH